MMSESGDKVAVDGALTNYRKALLENRQLTQQSGKTSATLAYHSQGPDRRYQILILDDEPNILNAEARDLTSRSPFQDLQMVRLHEANPNFPKSNIDFRFEVYATTSPSQALGYAARVAVDVVIVDYMMPEMNGIEFLKIFRELRPDASRIMLSGHTDKHILTEAINHMEIFSFISKPWRNYELRSAVTQAIIYKNLILENRQHKEDSAGLAN